MNLLDSPLPHHRPGYKADINALGRLDLADILLQSLKDELGAIDPHDHIGLDLVIVVKAELLNLVYQQTINRVLDRVLDLPGAEDTELAVDTFEYQEPSRGPRLRATPAAVEYPVTVILAIPEDTPALDRDTNVH